MLATPEMEPALPGLSTNCHRPSTVLYVPLFDRPVWQHPGVDLRGFR